MDENNIFDEFPDIPSGEIEAELSTFRARNEAAVEELKKRCEAANIPWKESESFDEPGEMVLELGLPSGRETRTRTISAAEAAELVAFRFEDYVLLSGYQAICSYSEGVIEAKIGVLNRFSPFSHMYRTLFGVRPSDESRISPVSLKLNGPRGQIISIVSTSKECKLLCGRGSPNELSIRISSQQLGEHDKAVEYLERLANSLFLQIDLAFDVPLSLIRERNPHERRRPLPRRENVRLQFPPFEYDREPMELYWYARSARGMPLLQFLAFYQAIEFYFPVYSKLDAQKRVRAILKEPTFDPSRDSDIGRVLTAIRAGAGKGFGDERSQLRATIEGCVTQEDLRQFLEADKDRRDFYAGKQKGASNHKIPVANQGSDLRGDVIERVYDIRCKIVHTKSGDEGEGNLLLPFSREADSLSFDVELVRYLAQQVLIVSSHNLRGT